MDIIINRILFDNNKDSLPLKRYIDKILFDDNKDSLNPKQYIDWID